MVDIDPTFTQRYSRVTLSWQERTLDAVLPENMHRYVLKTAGVSCIIAETFARIFYRNSINIGLPIIECPEASREIEEGDEVEIDFDSGKIYDRTKGTEYQGQAFPPFMQKIIDSEGLVNYINSKRK